MVQEAAGNDGILGSRGVFSLTEDDGLEVVSGGSGNDNLLGAGVDVRLGLSLGAVEAGALQHDIHVQLTHGSSCALGIA